MTTADGTQKDDKGVWTGGPSEYRVHDVKIYNKETGAWDALDLAATYNLAGYNYTLRDLGDGFAMFDGAVNVLDYVMEDYMVLSNYVLAFDGGVVDATNSPLAAKYANFTVDYSTVNGSGRIELVEGKAEVAPETDATEVEPSTEVVEEAPAVEKSNPMPMILLVVLLAAVVIVFVVKKNKKH